MVRKTRKTRAAEFAVLAAALGLFIFAAQSSPTTLTRMPLMVGSAIVGVSAAVAQNADNTLAADLAAKEAELAAREAALDQSTSPANDALARYSLVASASLFGLLSLNYALDWRRNARARREFAA
jgi:hypothetical protein